MIGKTGENLVFLLGIARSGTTLLSVMLNNHPEIRCPPEPWLMLGLEAIGRTSARHPADAPVLYRALRQFCDEESTIAGAREFAATVYQRHLAGCGKKILVDKTPRYFLILPFLREVFPDARFIALWRNPLDAAASMKSAWGFDLPRLLSEHQDHLACIDLILGPRRIHEFTKKHPGIIYSLQYEQLARQPRETMDQLFNWLGVSPQSVDQFDLTGGEFDRSEYGDKKILATANPHDQSIGVWRNAFSTDEIGILLDMIGPNLLSAIGYSEVIEQAAEMGITVTGAGNSNACAQRLERNLAQRLAEYDSAPSYAELTLLESKLARLLGTAPTADLAEEFRTNVVAVEKISSDLQTAQGLFVENAATRTELDAQRKQLDAKDVELQASWSRERAAAEKMEMLQAQLHRQSAELESHQQRVAERDLQLQESSVREKIASDRLASVVQEFAAASQLQRAGWEGRLQELNQRLASATEEFNTQKQIHAQLSAQLQTERESATELKAQLDESLAAISGAVHEQQILQVRLDQDEAASMRARVRRLGYKMGLVTIPPVAGNGQAANDMTDTLSAQSSRLGVALRHLADRVKSAAAVRPDLMDTAIEHLAQKNFSPKVIFDIGAAKGYWTQRHVWRWPQAEVFLVDPLLESEPFLKALCEKDPRFHYLLTAVGKESTEMTINLNRDLDGSSLLPFPNPDAKRQRQIPVQRLDDLIVQGKLKPPDMVKLDVQGFEIQAMDGGQKMFETAEVFIIEVNIFRFMENCPRVDEVVRYMSDRKFVFFDLAGMLRRPFENDLGQMDIVFVAERSPLLASNRWL